MTIRFHGARHVAAALGTMAMLGLAAPAAAEGQNDSDAQAGTERSPAGLTFSERVERTWSEMKAFGAEQSEAARKNSAALVRNMESGLESLKRDSAEAAESASDTAGEGWDATMKTLRDLKAEAAEDAEALGNASGEAWESAKREFRESSRAFAEAYDEAKRKLGPAEPGEGGDTGDSGS